MKMVLGVGRLALRLGARVLAYATTGFALGTIIGCLQGAIFTVLMSESGKIISGIRWGQGDLLGNLYAGSVGGIVFGCCVGVLSFAIIGATCGWRGNTENRALYRAMSGAWRGALIGATAGLTFAPVLIFVTRVLSLEFLPALRPDAAAAWILPMLGGWLLGFFIGTLWAGWSRTENWLVLPLSTLRAEVLAWARSLFGRA